MDASLLTHAAFWSDGTPALPGIPELAGHVLFESSGSTGDPKWIAISKQALLVSAAAVNRHLGVTKKSCWGLALPPRHVGGFGVAARAYEAGCGFRDYGRPWDAAEFREWLALHKITHTSLVPTQVHDLVKAKLTAPASLAAIVVGGGHLDASTGQAARDLGWPVLASYGMTEAASQIATQDPGQLQAVYRPAPIPLLPIWEARLTPENLLAISGPALFSGHVSGGRFIPRETDWHITADRVLLENKTITPLGRADVLVKILGELVDPEAIERELISISEGRLTPGTFAIIAIPDKRAGGALVPLFESSVNSKAAEAVLSLYQSQAPGYRRLMPLVVVRKFPRSELGKLRRNELVAIYLNQTTR
jgi:O-succinylbenzoic acid--CoA ligase